MTNDHGLKSTVDKTGFPLQIALARAVETTRVKHDFAVLYEEHAWKHPNGKDEGFLDLVLEDKRQVVALTIECKRTADADWIFLFPGTATNRTHVRAWFTTAKRQIVTRFGWADFQCQPATPESAYCVARRHKDSAIQSLEAVGGELLTATEALADEDLLFMRAKEGDSSRAYFAIVVTTARLQLCQFDPDKVSLVDGTLPDDATFVEVPCIRFRKQLSTARPKKGDFGSSTARDALVRSKERTVFVVNAAHFTTFLEAFSFDDDSLREVIFNPESA